ncbi:MAG: M23 family metallopeptidase [Rhodospirillales bacterium]
MIFRGLLAILVAVILAGASTGALFKMPEWPPRVGAPADDPSPHPEPVAALDLEHASEADSEPVSHRHLLRVERGDTLGGMLTRVGVPGQEANAAFAALRQHFDPRRIRAGQEVALTLEPASEEADGGRLLDLTVTSGPLEEIIVERTAEGGFVASKSRKATATALARASGTITSSLFVDGERVGVPVAILVELIRAYSWDVDFQRDIHPGDRFEILYQRIVDVDGHTVHHGDIAYAALTVGGKRKALYRYVRSDGEADFFELDGKSVRKALLRTPVDGARLSSGFGNRRHPILGYTRMHRGVDFAAPPGTPIYAAGSGTVEIAGRKGSYGNYVRIRHNAEYATAYAHMRGFARGIRAGTRVKQGQVIGYVGSTGSSTGPHLHYEVIRGGVQINPINIKVATGPKLDGNELKRFLAHVAETDRQFALLDDDLRLARAPGAPYTAAD